MERPYLCSLANFHIEKKIGRGQFSEVGGPSRQTAVAVPSAISSHQAQAPARAISFLLFLGGVLFS